MTTDPDRVDQERARTQPTAKPSSGLVDLPVLTAYLDEYLRIGVVPDEPNAMNGLQVENAGHVGAIFAAVDASQATIDRAVERAGALGTPALILVHHGLFWDGNRPVTGRRFRRLSRLIAGNLALYAAHIPLDVHPEVGNNVLLARALGLEQLAPFDLYQGVAIGWRGRLSPPVHREQLAGRLHERLGGQVRVVPGGPESAAHVGVITGAAGSRIAAARAAGLDTFITGEGAHHTYFDAMELGVNVIYAGHYATEQLGVQALAAHVSERFGIAWEYHDHPTGL